MPEYILDFHLLLLSVLHDVFVYRGTNWAPMARRTVPRRPLVAPPALVFWTPLVLLSRPC